MSQQYQHRIKFNSSDSSSSQSVELPVHKTLSNGKRYDLIKDTSSCVPSSSPPPLWIDSLPNRMRFQCCTTTTTTTASASSNSEQNSMNIHKNPINTTLNECRQQLNPYATTGIFQQVTSTTLPNYVSFIFI